MAFKYKLLLILSPAILVLDQITKLAVVAWLAIGERIPIIPGFFDLVSFRNTGAAFGMFSGADEGFRVPFFYAVAVVAVVMLGAFYRSLKDEERLLPVAFALVFGGIAGNILDRIRLGAVVDFLSFHIGDAALQFSILGRAVRVDLEWPAFNVADSAITVAMFLLLFSILPRKRKDGKGLPHR